MFCTHCGASLPDDASFCIVCGTPVPGAEAPAADAADGFCGPSPEYAAPVQAGGPRRRTGMVVGVVLVLVVVLAGAGVGAMWWLGVGPFAGGDDEAAMPAERGDEETDHGSEAAGREEVPADGGDDAPLSDGDPEGDASGEAAADETGHELVEAAEGTVYRNEAYGLSFMLPDGTEPERYLVDRMGRECGVEATDPASGLTVRVMGRANDGSSLQEVMDEESSGRAVHYSASEDDWFVLSWDEGGTVYYLREFVGPSGRDSVLYSYPVEESEAGDAAVEATFDTLEPGDLTVER